jgi:hypothetical protein
MEWTKHGHVKDAEEEYDDSLLSKWARQLPDSYPDVNEDQRSGRDYIGDEKAAAVFMLKNTMGKYVMEGGASRWNEYKTRLDTE